MFLNMISQLTVQNFGLIDLLTVDFSKGLNVLTGETGAGKSLIIDALHYVLGSKLNTSQIREPDKVCIVEAVFDLVNSELKESTFFSEYISKDEPVLIINRAYFPDGRNKNKINGFNITLSQLKELGNLLVDFHGPHDHQMLFSEDSHIKILDRLAQIEEFKKDFVQKYDIYTDFVKKSEQIHNLSVSRERELDMLIHEIKELEQVPLDTAEYEKLLEEHTRVNNAEKLHEAASCIMELFENEERGISSAISQTFAPLKMLNNLDESTSKLKDAVSHIQENSEEFLSELTRYIDSLSFQSGEAEKINARYDIYYEILRKYGPSLKAAKKLYSELKEKYEFLMNIEYNDAVLKEKINSSKEEAEKIAEKISILRKKTSKNLENTIKEELKELGITQVQFECRIEKTELNHAGIDKVILYISPNPGEPLKPLAEIVSSGEAARIMLALKKALTDVDMVPVLIFDEIDAQIGGRLGTATGKKLKELSENRQVILITHLPQIASFGNRHFKVSKSVKASRTLTNVAVLENNARVEELAKMMSGEKKTEIALKHAYDMLTRAEE